MASGTERLPRSAACSARHRVSASVAAVGSPRLFATFQSHRYTDRIFAALPRCQINVSVLTSQPRLDHRLQIRGATQLLQGLRSSEPFFVMKLPPCTNRHSPRWTDLTLARELRASPGFTRLAKRGSWALSLPLGLHSLHRTQECLWMSQKMSALPCDVNIDILEWVYRTSQAKKMDYSTLCAASLVCRSWRPLAQRLLFRRVRQRQGMPHILINILRRNRALGRHVRSLTVQSHAVDMADLLECCPGTVELILEMPQITLSYLSNAAPRLRALDLQINVLDVRGAGDVGGLLEVWPSIRFLVLTDNYLPSRRRFRDPLCGIKMSKSLFHNRLLDLLILPGLSTLREIEIDDSIPHYPKAPVNAWFTRVAPLLTSFTSYFPPANSLHEHFESLEKVVFCSLPDWSFWFPPHVRHVGYHAREGTEPARVEGRALARFVDALSALPSLRLVTVTRVSRKSIFSVLEETCRTRGAEFIVYPDAASFPRPRNVDWI
ncbi:hypothetical protein BV25DRAFT_456984 [Artomyces pyxidatus]|uniref:Uncharacterized protein n=1 Tax=Artomyces pyxidatus TaxID=48021 RepID=A0ACB8T4X9_9AGAM|nr:hypothetical protein BV25DRAFT_456984 [Artomyces pyxidatus]